MLNATYYVKKCFLSPTAEKTTTRVTNQGQRHAHDHRGVDVVEGGDLKHVAVRVWV